MCFAHTDFRFLIIKAERANCICAETENQLPIRSGRKHHIICAQTNNGTESFHPHLNKEHLYSTQPTISFH